MLLWEQSMYGMHMQSCVSSLITSEYCIFQVQKKKIWESVQPHLKTTEACVAVLDTLPMRTSAGEVTCKSLKNARIS